MKKQCFFISLISLAILFLIACKKESIHPVLKKRIIKEQHILQETNDTILVNYSYDSLQRLMQIQQLHNFHGIDKTITYDYSQANQVVEIPINRRFYNTVVYIIDSTKKVNTSYLIDTITNRAIPNSYNAFYYNANSQLSKETNEVFMPQTYKKTIVYTYFDGNLIKTTDNYLDVINNIQTIQEDVYEYNFSINNTLGNEQYGKSFLGKTSKNAYTKLIHTISKSTNGVSTVISNTINNVSYEVDSDGFIIKKKDVSTTDNIGGKRTLTDVYSYFYN